MKYVPLLFCIVFFLFSCASAKPKNTPIVADMDPVSVGTVTFEMEKAFSSALEQKQATVVFDPRTDTVYLKFSYQTITYQQFWDRSGREHFITALEQYQKDLEARNLTPKSAKSRRVYGSVKGKVEWGQFSFNINARGYPAMDLGYLFKKDNPYFTVLQQEAKDTIFGDRESVRITTYFTRTQASALAAIFDQDYLLANLDITEVPPASTYVPDTY